MDIYNIEGCPKFQFSPFIWDNDIIKHIMISFDISKELNYLEKMETL